ncbi:thioredoxin family protein [bacterium]|nr:thioredoxin family protein [bacterium]
MSSTGCHFCSDARDLFRRLSIEFDVRVREVDLESMEGAAALRQWRVPFPPIVVIDGELFGYGRISERKVRRTLSRART